MPLPLETDQNKVTPLQLIKIVEKGSCDTEVQVQLLQLIQHVSYHNSYDYLNNRT
jgi:hypothetical protein